MSLNADFKKYFESQTISTLSVFTQQDSELQKQSDKKDSSSTQKKQIKKDYENSISHIQFDTDEQIMDQQILKQIYQETQKIIQENDIKEKDKLDNHCYIDNPLQLRTRQFIRYFDKNQQKLKCGKICDKDFTNDKLVLNGYKNESNQWVINLKESIIFKQITDQEKYYYAIKLLVNRI